MFAYGAVTEGSSESEILNARTEILRPEFELISTHSKNNLLDPCEKVKEEKELNRFANISLNGPPFLHCDEKASILEEVSINVIRDMDAYGVCVVDHFLGPELGKKVLDEVINMYSRGVFKDGQTVSARAKSDLKTIRGDQITWLDGTESHCKSIGCLISKVDTVVKQANKVNRFSSSIQLARFVISIIIKLIHNTNRLSFFMSIIDILFRCRIMVKWETI